MYDVIIVGAGAAGLTAALYTGRKNLKTLVVSVDVGGQCNLTSSIENYPGIEKMPGFQLTREMEKQVKKAGVEVITGKVIKVEKKSAGFVVKTKSKEFEGKTVILAIGRVPRTLDIPGEADYLGKGVHTCTTCDAPLYGKKTVAVIGGGNSAVDGALEISRVGAEKVYLIHRRVDFRADEMTLEKAKKDKKVEIMTPYSPVEIKGDKFVKSIVLKNNETNEGKELKVDGVFLEIGSIVNTSLVKDLVEINESNEIVVDTRGRTSQEGVFAAGDATTVIYKQCIIAAGEGAKAALEAYNYLTGGKGLGFDWAKK
ncbi:MAG: FAD-dependent oxidoreductase [Nanoarchaeota archaeon]|nr:FAD-dependent oxidoreductase [Nanoarchaeota archaeon]